MLFLKKLSTNDGRQVYDMLQGIASVDNGFHNDAKDMPYEQFASWLSKNEGYSHGVGLPDWMVPETHYWLFDDGKPVGYGRLRHYLNDSLRINGGHIGYAISRPYRGNGYGNEILRLLISEANEKGIQEIHIGANKDNDRSNKVIRANGGKLLRETDTKNYYIICPVSYKKQSDDSTQKNIITIEPAAPDDCPTLAVMNRQLIIDEGDANTMTVSELESRMRDWFKKGAYTGYLFRIRGETVGYALVDLSDMWMQHFFICRDCRQQGYGRAAVELLFDQLGVEKIGLSCLTNNAIGQAFWRSFDYDLYSVKFNIHRPNKESLVTKSVKQTAEVMIRKIEDKDYLALLPLWSQFGGYATVENIVPHYDRIKNDDHYKIFVALSDNAVVGFITSVRYYGIGVEGSYMIIIGIAVKADEQNKGIGTKLLQYMENYAKEEGVFSIHLNSDLKRTMAHAFYERNGYNKGSYGFGKIITPCNA